MENVVNRFIERHQLLTKGATVIVGVSGGPDSMVLLHYLLRKKEAWNLTIVVAHVNHMLRDSAREDFAYVESFCQKFDIKFEGIEIDVQAYQKEHQCSIQVASRECRYQFFEQMMNTYQADYLALGHHGDDQIETILMRQVRGVLGFGRAGIPVKREFAGGFIVRPLLCVERLDIEQYVTEHQLHPRLDPTNEQLDYVRNRFRHKVLPFLKSENPKVHMHFQNQSESLYADEQFLQTVAEQYVNSVTEQKKRDKVTINVNRFLSIPSALQTRVVQLVLSYLYHSRQPIVTSVHIEQILVLMKGENPSGMLHLPDSLYVLRSYERIVFTFTPEQKHQKFAYTVSVPFELQLPHGYLRGKVSEEHPCDDIHSETTFVGDAHAFEFPLTIRTRTPGDRMTPKGMNGSKKVKSIFIDEKIARRKRDSIPIIEDANGEIIWVVGVKQTGVGSISKNTTHFLYLAYES